MDKNDWYFIVSTVLAVVALFGLDWRLVRGRIPVPQLTGHNILFFLLIIGSLLMSGIGWYRSSHRENYPFTYLSSESLDEIRGRKFVNEPVSLDGHRYTFCTFENVRFDYNGTGSFGFDNNTIIGTVTFGTKNPAIAETAGLFKGFGLLKSDIPITAGPDYAPINVMPPVYVQPTGDQPKR